jgi:hypothetical protein
MAVELTTALGRLLRDAALRQQFRQNPTGIASALGVPDDSLCALTSLNLHELDLQAEMLLKKRFHEVQRLLPDTFNGLGATAYEQFVQYAGDHWPQGHQRHIEDAAGFGQYLLEHARAYVCRSELNRVAFLAGRRRITVHWVPDGLLSGRRRHAIQILYRLRGWPRQLVFYLG